MTQTELNLPIHGKSYDKDKDGKRIQSMRQRIWTYMAFGRWTDIEVIRKSLNLPAACDISRRIREMRKIGFKIITKRDPDNAGRWYYLAVKK